MPAEKFKINQNVPILKLFYKKKYFGHKRNKSNIFFWIEEDKNKLELLQSEEIVDFTENTNLEQCYQSPNWICFYKDKNILYERQLEVL